MSFTDLGLSPKVLSAVEGAGYSEPTPIQAGAIPIALQRRDVLGIAQTGTGKTASFVLPMLTLLERGRARARMPRSLIMEPTRELAAQVAENFEKYGTNHKLNVALLIGGVSFKEQDTILQRGADVVIATPGRLLDHFERGKLLLTGTEIFVIDEADRMLDMGFIPDIERIAKLIPFTRQTLFFSATMPPEITRLADQFLQNPQRVEVSKPAATADTVEQRLVRTGRKPHEKRAALRDLVRAEDGLTNAIIFCNRKRDVADLYKSLQNHDFSVGALHGDMDQRSRMAMLDDFKNDRVTLMVASDVAARGLDIPAVSHVFNYDVPIHAEDYVHRIGRTGRAGRAGKSFTLVPPGDDKYVDAITDLIGKKIDWTDGVDVGDERDAEASDGGERRASRRGGRGRRKAPIAVDASEADASARGDRTTDAPAPSEPDGATNDVPEPQAEARAEARPRRGRSERSSEQPRGGRRSARRGDDDGPRVIGFGNEVPAFMRIEVPSRLRTGEADLTDAA